MSIIENAAKLFMQQIGQQGDGLDLSSVVAGLKNLLPGDGGDLDIQALIEQFMGQSGGLATLASSWLGGGDNMDISASQLTGLLGQDKVAEFAENTGVDVDTAVSGLTGMIPQLIDQSSEDGALKTDLASSLVSGLAGKFL
jgi:uncharacterized protein YidB (DUF937 family)